MSDDEPASAPPGTSPPRDEGRGPEGHVAAHVDRGVSRRAAESAGDKPAPHGTPHEVAGSPVRNPKDLEGDGSPGTSNKATKRLPP